ncbi:unnamed protein product [Haemonchus placei]|uniref:Uncharacterized protein n=1 Tax=Haemonchus placei TaxID=6290 RepID=A0A0N4VTB2_HAEPC|nr:unnamed protein product [Haemonchus placei]
MHFISPAGKDDDRDFAIHVSADGNPAFRAPPSYERRPGMSLVTPRKRKSDGLGTSCDIVMIVGPERLGVDPSGRRNETNTRTAGVPWSDFSTNPLNERSVLPRVPQARMIH